MGDFGKAIIIILILLMIFSFTRYFLAIEMIKTIGSIGGIGGGPVSGPERMVSAPAAVGCCGIGSE